MKYRKKQELTVKRIFSILKNHAGDLRKYSVKKIGIFGSYVRGEQKKRSDIDLLVEFDTSSFGKNFEGYFDTYMDLSFLLEEIFQKKVDLLTNEMISPHIRPYVLKEVKYLEGV
ncbi:MAG: nucleotidyltransferase family protein [Nitrospirae bacterium]|nr:nucleotidyltransferase family protein [Nitrospirota bacterium]